MDGALARKRPATVIPNHPIAHHTAKSLAYPRSLVITAPLHKRESLMRQVHQMAKRGEISHSYALRQTSQGWAVKIIQMRPPRPTWRRLFWPVAGVAGGILVFLALVAWLLKAILVAAIAAFPWLAGCAIALLLISALGLGTGITVIQKVTIK